MSEKGARSVHVASKSEALTCHIHVPLLWMVMPFGCCRKLVSRGQSSSCVDIAFRMFGCGLPVPQRSALGVGHRYSQSSCSQNISQCDIDFLMENATGSNMLRGMKRHIKRSPMPSSAPANGKSTRIESRNMHSRESLRIPRFEL